MNRRSSLTIFLLSNVWLYFLIHWLLDSLPAVPCQWKHPPQRMANSSMALNRGQISQSSADRSCLEKAHDGHISWVQPGPWLGVLQHPDPAGAVWGQKLPGLPSTTVSFLNIQPFLAVSHYLHFSLFLGMVVSMPECSASI